MQTPMLDGSVVSVVVDGQEISAAVFGTGDVSLQQVHDILEAYGDQLSEEPQSAGQSKLTRKDHIFPKCSCAM